MSNTISKEHPILFSTPMVQAILEDRKTVTRRIINPQPIIDEDSGSVFDGKYRAQYDIHNWKDRFIDDWCRWMPEDLLWVRETWSWHEDLIGSGWYVHKATDEKEYPRQKWKPSIHMFKEAARTWLEVLNIRIERLNDISEEDAIAEGIEKSMSGNGRIVYKNYLGDSWVPSPTYSYRSLWLKLHGEGSWELNPFVWRIEFKKTNNIL